MRAATYEQVGPAAEVLTVREVERPRPGRGEVLVRIVVSAINPTDVKTRAGLTPGEIDGYQVPHMDGAGVIEEVGDGVPAERIGERVWLMVAAASNRWGTAAEYSCIPAERALPLPDHASFDLGATLGVPAVTAAHCLFSDGPIDGRTVLVAGGAGAVGRYAVQLATWAGARVATTVSGPEKADVARAAGADLVVNYREPGALEAISAWAGGRVDRIVELALGPNLDMDLTLAAPGTVVVTYAIDGPDPVIPVRRCMMAGITLRFMLLYRVPPEQLAMAVGNVGRALADGALSEPPMTRFPLSQIVDAQQAQEAGPFGRILVDVDS
jgi:NADPH2:quinone reductase